MKRNLKKGFSLVELVVVTMLMGIITTMIVMIMRPAQKHYRNITNKAQQENACITITDLIDGELRYATGIQMIYTDKDGKLSDGSSISIDAANYPNYLKLSNDEREMIGNFRARGFAEKGKTSTMSRVDSVLSKKLFGDYDYQFSVSSTNTTAGKQSITLDITATPMLVTSNSVGYDTERSHTFSETFKLINIRNKGKVGDKVLGLSLAGDELPEDGIIWIFYALPKDVASAGGINTNVHSPTTGLGYEGAYDALEPTLYIKLKDELEEGEIRFDKLVFQATDGGYQGSWKVNIAGTGVTVKKPSGEQLTSGEVQVNADSTLEIYFEPGSTASVKIIATDWPNGARDFDTILANRFPEDNLVEYLYIYAEDTDPIPGTVVHTDEYLPAGALDKEIILHYITAIGETGSGVNFSDASSMVGYRVNGQPNIYGIDCTGDTDISVRILRDTAYVYASPKAGTKEPKDKIKLDKDSAAEYWIYDGEISETRPTVPDPITVHYLYRDGDNVCGFVTVLEAGGANSVAANETVLTPQPAQMTGDEISFDVIFKMKSGSRVGFKSLDSSGAFFGGISADDGITEYWIYQDHIYPERPDVEEYSEEVRIHYVQCGTDRGIGFADSDTKTSPAMVDGRFLEEKNTDSATTNDISKRFDDRRDHDITITFKKGNGRVRIFRICEYNDGPMLLDITNDSIKDIWIFNGEVYDETQWSNIQGQIDAALEGFGSYGDGTPEPDPRCYTMAIDIPASSMNSKMFIQNSILILLKFMTLLQKLSLEL